MIVVAVQVAEVGEAKLDAFLGVVNAIRPLSQGHAHPAADGMAIIAIHGVGPE